MSNPYIQVALTYLRHPFRSFGRSLLISIVLFLLVVFFFVTGRTEQDHTLKPFQLLLFVVFFAFFATHLKEQFANSRASLTPGFRKAHGMVALIVAIFFSIILPGIMAPMIGWQSFGFVAILMPLFGAILWFILRPGGTFSLVIMAVWIPILFPAIQKSLEQIALGNKPFQAFTFFGVGAVLSITGIIRLFLLHEELPEYHLNLQIPIDGRIKHSDLQWQKMEKWYSQGWRHRWANKPIVNLIYHARHATDSYWSRVNRWNYSNLRVWVAFFLAIVINLVVTVMDVFTDTRLPLPIEVFIATLIPAFVAIGFFNVKNRFIAQDLMMPVRRDSYLKELGMSFASSQFIVWAVIMAVSITWMCTATEKTSPDSLAYATTYSIMMQIWMFGLAAWILSFRSVYLTFIIMNIAVIFTATPILAFEEKILMQWRSFILLFGGLLAAVGLLLTWWGYRRWLVADFN